MSGENAETIDESAANVTRDWFRTRRRPLLKALGVGATLSLGGGLAAGAGDGSATQDGGESTSRQIHPTFGLSLAADEDVPDGIDPSQVVELHVEKEEDVHEGFPLTPDPENPEQFVESEEEFFFDPVGIHLAPDDVVHYENLEHLHTVTAFHEKFGSEMFPMPTRVPEGTPGFTSPIFVEDESWLYQFREPGVYDILCLPHLRFGMVQRVVVSADGDLTGLEMPPEPSREVPPNAQSVLTAPELDPQQIVESGTVGWSDLTLETGPPAETPAGTPTATPTETPE